jgi:probable F420-dependent oxidoreductase
MSETVVESARRALGPVGAFLPVPTTRAATVGELQGAVRTLEGAGYAAAWTNEVVGKDALVQLAVLLGATTTTMAFGTGIANIWARPAPTAHAAAALLAEAYPCRLVLGLGVGYPEQAASVGRPFGRPLATMRRYLEEMGAPSWLPGPDAAYPHIVGANGPKMLALAGESADGAMPAMAPSDFTVQAREVLGPDKLLVVLVQTALDGGAAETVDLVRAHLEAGADHVTVGLPIGTDVAPGVDRLVALAPALLGAG